jgi:peptide deformylase
MARLRRFTCFVILKTGGQEMALRNIRTLGDEILRKHSKAIDIIDDKILYLLKDMADTMYKNEGVGLAAPQVGILKRLVVIDLGQGLMKLINPVIVEAEGSHEVIEGCLSVPGKFGKLRFGKLVRPEKVKVKALNEKGEELLITGEGDLAKCLCHEIDHLDGILYIDMVTEFLKD